MIEKECVWDYPRPPRLEVFSKPIRIEFAGKLIVESTHTIRVLETSHPPVYYIPRQDIRPEFIHPAPGQSFCEWKGKATYWSIIASGKRAERAAWSYETPAAPFSVIRGYLAFYPSLMDACFVDGEKAVPQSGKFYGGWITSNLIGPFK